MRPVSRTGNFFQHVRGYNPGRSVFDLSYERHLTCKFGLLYPVWIQEGLPGDHMTIGADALIRMQPTTVPSMGRITATYHVFFVPKRIVWKKWEEFITRGKDGRTIIPLCTWPRVQSYRVNNNGLISNSESFVQRLPNPQDAAFLEEVLGYIPAQSPLDIDQLWDHLELPPRVNADVACPMTDDTLRRAYYLIFNDYYRDENLLDEIQNIDGDENPDTYGVKDACYVPFMDKNGSESVIHVMQWLMPRAWRKDYFTSALPWPQRGVSPAIPLTGTTSAVWSNEAFDLAGNAPQNMNLQAARNQSIGGKPGYVKFTTNSSSRASDMQQLFETINRNTISLSGIGTITMLDLNVGMKVQYFQELNARGGARYIETLQSQWNESPSDARLQRPEYIGGCKIPVVISEVVQTSGAIGGTPQGNMAGHGMSVSGNYVGKYKAEEYGWFIGLLSFETDTFYQQGLKREYSRLYALSQVWPIFAGMPEQGILESEIFLPRTTRQAIGANASRIFGFQARYNECRVRENSVTGQMRVYSPADYTDGYIQAPAAGVIPASLSFWNFSRYFGEVPKLNWKFLVMQPPLDNYLVQVEPPFIVQWGNNVRAVRRLPYEAIPSLAR